MKFDLSPELSKGKVVSTSQPDWANGGDYTTPKQGVKPMKPQAIVTSGGGVGEWAKGGGDVSVGKQSVGHCKPL